MQFKHLCLITITVLSLVLPTFAQEPTVLEHGGGGIWTVAFSPVDASLVASAGEDGTIKLWNLQANTGATLATHDDSINSIAFSPDGQLLASGSDDFTVKVWSVPTKQIVATLEHVVDGFEEAVTGVSFSPDGKQLATAGPNVKLWDVSTWTVVKTIQPAADWVWNISFSPDGKWFATTLGEETTVTIWDTQSGQELTTLEGHAGDVQSVKFSPDNRTLASAAANGTIKLWAGSKLWPASKWSHLGTMAHPDRTSASRAEGAVVSDIAFSRDGRTLVSGGYQSLVLWSVGSGEKLTTLVGHTGQVYASAFSREGNALASGGEDGKLRIWDLTPYASPEQLEQRDIVRLIYFTPSDMAPLPDIETQVRNQIKDTQQFFADEMQVHGFGRKTFTFETNEDSEPLVHWVDGKFDDAYYHADTGRKVREEIFEQFDMSKDLYLIVTDISSESIDDEHTCGVGWNPVFEDVGGWKGSDERWAIIPAFGNCLAQGSGVPLIAHELGHAFGLEHDFGNDAYIMSYGGNPDRLARCSAEWLDASRFFNTHQIYFNERGTISEPELYEIPLDAIRMRFEVMDADGLHLAQLIIPATAADPSDGVKLQGCQSLSGQRDTVEFIVSGSPNEVTLQIIDVYGNTNRMTYQIEQDEVLPIIQNPLDVNGDETIDTADLLVIAGSFGQRVTPGATPNPADVNGDNIVDIEDIILVAAAMDADAAAPATQAHSVAGLTTTDLRRWLDAARQLKTVDAKVVKAIAVLEQLLAIVRPKETRLMTNYPNPFNPETWIPYQLATDTEVTLSIYDMNGRLIRALALGHKPAGVYQSRSRAAYWDGRNELGEPVASGVYFYTLTAGHFTATQKMLIRK